MKNLSYTYGKRNVLFSVDLFIPKGNITFILDPNGSGKTTLFRRLNGILKLEGCVLIEGKDLSEFSLMEIAKIIEYG